MNVYGERNIINEGKSYTFENLQTTFIILVYIELSRFELSRFELSLSWLYAVCRKLYAKIEMKFKSFYST